MGILGEGDRRWPDGKVQLYIGTGGMEVSVVHFTPCIHVLACMLLRSVALRIKHQCLIKMPVCEPPPAPTKRPLTPELDKILRHTKAPNQLSAFLERERLYGVENVALVCTKEELLDEALIAPAKAGGVPCDSLAEKVCIKKVSAL